jgi:hypothetical protein
VAGFYANLTGGPSRSAAQPRFGQFRIGWNFLVWFDGIKDDLCMMYL